MALSCATEIVTKAPYEVVDESDYVLEIARTFENYLMVEEPPVADVTPDLIAALGVAEAALVDLSACSDEKCTEPNCLHALVVVRAALRRAQGGTGEVG